MEINKQMLAIFVLSLVTAILLAMVISDRTNQRTSDDLDSYYQGIISEMNSADEVYKNEINSMIWGLQDNLSQLQVEKQIFIETQSGYNTSEVNAMLIEIANRMFEHNDEIYSIWTNNTQEALQDAYDEGRRSKRSRTYIINPGLSVS